MISYFPTCPRENWPPSFSFLSRAEAPANWQLNPLTLLASPLCMSTLIMGGPSVDASVFVMASPLHPLSTPNPSQLSKHASLPKEWKPEAINIFSSLFKIATSWSQNQETQSTFIVALLKKRFTINLWFTTAAILTALPAASTIKSLEQWNKDKTLLITQTLSSEISILKVIVDAAH